MNHKLCEKIPFQSHSKLEFSIAKFIPQMGRLWIWSCRFPRCCTGVVAKFSCEFRSSSCFLSSLFGPMVNEKSHSDEVFSFKKFWRARWLSAANWKVRKLRMHQADVWSLSFSVLIQLELIGKAWVDCTSFVSYRPRTSCDRYECGLLRYENGVQYEDGVHFVNSANEHNRRCLTGSLHWSISKCSDQRDQEQRSGGVRLAIGRCLLGSSP